MLGVSAAAAFVAAVAGAAYLWLATRRAAYPSVWSLPWQVQPRGDRRAIPRAAARLAILCVPPLLVTVGGGSPPRPRLATVVQAAPAPAPVGAGATWLGLVFAAAGLVIVAATLGLAVYLAARLLRRRLASPPSATGRDVNEELAQAAAAALDILSIGGDARRAILAAYALMERALARRGVPRSPQETAPEFARRVLEDAGAPEEPVQSLTGLFQLAAFSSRPVTERMRREAVRSLRAISEAM